MMVKILFIMVIIIIIALPIMFIIIAFMVIKVEMAEFKAKKSKGFPYYQYLLILN